MVFGEIRTPFGTALQESVGHSSSSHLELGRWVLPTRRRRGLSVHLEDVGGQTRAGLGVWVGLGDWVW